MIRICLGLPAGWWIVVVMCGFLGDPFSFISYSILTDDSNWLDKKLFLKSLENYLVIHFFLFPRPDASIRIFENGQRILQQKNWILQLSLIDHQSLNTLYDGTMLVFGGFKMVIKMRYVCGMKQMKLNK